MPSLPPASTSLVKQQKPEIKAIQNKRLQQHALSVEQHAGEPACLALVGCRLLCELLEEEGVEEMELGQDITIQLLLQVPVGSSNRP